MTTTDADADARALHDADDWGKNPDGSRHDWETCNEEHRQRYRNLAERLRDEE